MTLAHSRRSRSRFFAGADANNLISADADLAETRRGNHARVRREHREGSPLRLRARAVHASETDLYFPLGDAKQESRGSRR